MMKRHIKLVLLILIFSILSCSKIDGSSNIPQVTGLKVFHQNGQTFIVWNGIERYGEPSAEDEVLGGLLQPAFKKKLELLKKAEKEGKKISYQIYRSTNSITSTSIKSAELIADVQPLSVYYPFHLGMTWYGEIHKNSVIPRIAVEPLKTLNDGQEVYVHTIKKNGRFFYAVTNLINGKENTSITAQNSLNEPIFEQISSPEPVLQRVRKIDRKQHYLYQHGPAEVHYYMMWVDEPYSNKPQGFEWAVAIPKGCGTEKKPAVLQLYLHPWGGNPDTGTFWYDVKPCTIRVSTVNFPPQDWWYGYRMSYGHSKQNKNDIVFNYTERRLMHFIDWVKKNWEIDENRIFVEGSSMGGTGAMHFGMKNGDIFAYANSWVGIGSWRNSTYFRKGERVKWGEIDELMNYNGVKFDDWMDLSWWLSKYPQKETSFLSFANGKNDDQIGWYQAVVTVKALQETKRPFVFRWGMGGHGERAIFMFNPEIMALDKSIPAFHNCSLDNKIGNGTKLSISQKFKTQEGKVLDDWYDGDSKGQINAYLLWESVVEGDDKYEITVFLTKEAPKDTCTVDITPRRTQKFKAKPGEKFKWSNISLKDGKEIQAGAATSDQWGLVTIEKLIVSKGKNRVKIWK
jgi:hypothetical protein